MIEDIGDWQRIYSNEVLPELEGKKVIVMGWAREIRDLGKLKFLVLADREGFIQITAKKGEVSDDLLKKIDSITRESVLAVKGEVKANKQAPGGREIVPEEIKILNVASQPLPLEVTKKTSADLDTRLNQRVLDLRKPENLAIFKIQSKLIEGMENFLRKKNYIQVFTPSLMGSASESGAEVFSILYYEREAFLRQDPQLHRQLLIGAGFDKIFDIGPSWRAEPSHTTRHLCEHRGCAVEIAFIKNEQDTMRVEEELIIEALRFIKKECKKELEILNKKIRIPEKPFPELRFPKIYEILEKMGKEIPFGSDYDRESEKLLYEYVKKKYGSEFFFVNRFPFKEKPFYVMRVDDDPQWARSVDLLYKGLELSSGGQREHRYEYLIKNIKEKRMNLENLKWFTEFFKYGMPPHGGFNIGIERLTMQLLDLTNIREATLFPRDTRRLLP